MFIKISSKLFKLDIKTKTMNRTIKLLMLSDIFLLTGFGLIQPILAIFIKENLIGGTIFAAGFATALFLIAKSVVQLPFSRYVDKHDKKIKWLVIGTLLIATVPFLYIFSTNIYHIYLAQIIHGIGSAFAYPTWFSLWVDNLDKKHEGFEWSIYSTLVGIGAALAAVLGSIIAEFVGFIYTFLLVGILSLVGCFILFGLEKKNVKSKNISLEHYHKHRKLVHKFH